MAARLIALDQTAEGFYRRPLLERFPAKHALGLDPGVDTGSREENASKQKPRARFRFNRNGALAGSVSI